ncbi:MAG: transposase [Candidatus Schekmanbacteria bacterium]|nr:transposase [Candidatus Schekmanbacteria bacterium]
MATKTSQANKAKARPTRTIRRISLPLNRGKWDQLGAIAKAYAREKDQHLLDLANATLWAEMSTSLAVRDAWLEIGYVSLNSLQARQWKTALKEAFDTVDRQWASLAERIRSLVSRQKDRWSEPERHYAFWLLADTHRMAALVSSRAPQPSHFELSEAQCRRVRNYLRRVIRRTRGRDPRVKTARSFVVDADMYSVFANNGRQVLAIMSLVPRQRILVPLTGEGPISGNLRIVLDKKRQRLEVHVTNKVHVGTPLAGEVAALDAGITEVFADEKGNRYGLEFGELLAAQSDEVCRKGRRRSKLRAMAEKARARGNKTKARRIRRMNLGYQKLTAKRQRMHVEVTRQINQAIGDVLKKRKPAALVTEKLDIRGKTPSKRLSRIVSSWARRALKDRVELKASAGGSGTLPPPAAAGAALDLASLGSRREQVNPSYSSQTCPKPDCGFVHPDNRQGDRFQCLHCGCTGESDVIAAINLKARYKDPDIFLWTPKEQVKSILLSRFNARLDPSGTVTDGTVSGRTPETEATTSNGQRGRRKPPGGRPSQPSIPPRQSESETTSTIPSQDGRKVIRGRAAERGSIAPQVGENAGERP